ncbi:LPXTG cell wall anchor domain-containing protein [Streptomyces sp. NPDC059262]|uniref:LPXTG cell wall anchor domain-containing protein n=1 Tax=Streptomyces sp. NPDC059262 TaxID=3346797 RepID=UPI0036A7D56A
MTKKTRIRVARIAAGAVIAAGASLTAAGAASALDIGVNLPGVGANVHAGDDGVGAGVAIGDEDPNPPTQEPPTDEPPTDEPPTEEPPTVEPPTDPTEEPTEPTEDPTTPGNGGGNGGGHHGGGGGNHGGGNGNTDPDGGNNPVEQGQGKDSLQDTGSVPAAQPAQNGKSGGELAETGAAETTFLLIGAATMIAGGIGFRLLPRLVGGGRTIA